MQAARLVEIIRSMAATALVLVPCVASAMMAPTVYRDARMRAPHHVQISISKVTPPDSDQGKCLVEGQVVRVFKGRLKRQARVRLTLSCAGPAIGRAPIPTPLMVGGALYTSTSDLQRARFLEAFLDGNPIDITLDQAVIIPATTPRPVCRATQAAFACQPGSTSQGQ